MGGALLASCGGLGDGAAVGGETHFLVTCGDDCGAGLMCIDGACTRRCEPEFSSCSELAVDATCVSPANDSDAREPFGGTCDVLCTDDSDCGRLGRGFSCRSGACRAEPEARQGALSTGRNRAALVDAVDTSTCDTGLRWVGGDAASAEMHPGRDCVGCHRETGARSLLVGGTLYPNAGFEVPLPLDGCYGLEGVEVVLTDFEGRERSTVTNRAGNFYFEGEPSELSMPYSTAIRWRFDGEEVRAQMFTMPTYGGCARCHGRSDLDASGPYTFDPGPEDVIPTMPIFTPGLYP